MIRATGTRVSRSFRALWFASTCVAWGLAGYAAFHTSESPQILNRYSSPYFVFLLCIVGLAVFISLLNVEPWPERLYKRRWDFALCVASTLLSLAVLEVGVRLMDPLGISYYAESARYHLDKVPDQDLVFRHRASWRARYQGVEVRLNELGLRDDPILPKQPSELRILALGDSVTFGAGVPQEEVFTARLQRLLTTRLARPVRVINAGVGGYNTVQEFRYFLKEGLSLSPDAVILTYVTNDVEVNEGPFDPWAAVSFQGKSPPQLARLVLWESWLYRLASHTVRYGLWGAQADASSLGSADARGWRDSMEALRNLRVTAGDRGIPLVVFFFRWQSNPMNTRLLEAVKRATAPSPVVDMESWFKDVDVRVYTISQVDSHPNSAGHAVIAARMADVLLRQTPVVTSFRSSSGAS